MSNWTDETWAACQEAAIKRGNEEYLAQLARHLKQGRRHSTLRYCPPDWHRSMVECLGREDGREDFVRLHLHHMTTRSRS